MSTSSTPFMVSLGRSAGKAAAYAWEGSRLASSQFATGAAEGYAEKAAELRAKKEALSASTGGYRVPTQRKVATAKA